MIHTTAKTEVNDAEGLARHRKQLGQYFTGIRLARLLAALARAENCQSAIDPMCGSGDMLAAVAEVSSGAALSAIEIDPSAHELCRGRFAQNKNLSDLILGDAFSWSTISKLSGCPYDLVITNPPYVRYQSLAQRTASSSSRSESVRHGLMEIARNLAHLDPEDRRIYLSIIKGYSGLSDLAVPSWILCAMLTRQGGRLAIVVPDAWLNRDYAIPIHYLLLKLFKIEAVIEDTDRAWFDEAQIKTTLVIAQKRAGADNIRAACEGQSYIHVGVPANAMTVSSVVGKTFSRRSNPERAFAKTVSILKNNPHGNQIGLSVRRHDLSREVAATFAAARNASWLYECEPNLERVLVSQPNFPAKIPQALADIVGISDSTKFTPLKALGVEVGQGLRTGANQFFYCDLIDEASDSCVVAPSPALTTTPISVPKDSILPVVRKQSELPDGYAVRLFSLRGRVLFLERYVHPDDAGVLSAPIDCGIKRSLMPTALAAFVSRAARINLGTTSSAKFIPHLSAVRTNVTSKKTDICPRFWYMLPRLAKRHTPELLIARVNTLHPKTFLNADHVVVDANFSTIWTRDGASVDSHAVLACLNSFWAKAAMEFTATVLGGGALKLEATHLRYLPMPAMSAAQWSELSALGKDLISALDTKRTVKQVDQLIAQFIFGKAGANRGLTAIKKLSEKSLENRKRK